MDQGVRRRGGGRGNHNDRSNPHQTFNINKLIEKTATSSECALLFKDYLKRYPRSSAGTIAKTLWKSPTREFTKYFGVADDAVQHFVDQYKDTMAKHYIQHILTHQFRLDDVSLAVYIDHIDRMTKESFAEFNQSTPLQATIQEFIKNNHLSSGGSYSQTIHQKLNRGDSELQLILNPELKFASNQGPYLDEDFPIDQPIEDDKWHPAHLGLSFHHFQRTVHNFITFPPPGTRRMEEWVVEDEFRDMPTLQKHYVLYMDQVADSNYEFLLAIVSAFGITAYEYPSTLLRIMQQRAMLIDFPELSTNTLHRSSNAQLLNADVDHLTSTFKDLEPFGNPSRSGESSGSNAPSSEVDELLARYKQKYPRHATATMEKTFWKSTKRELDYYLGSYVNKFSKSFAHLETTFAVAYLQHLLRFQVNLDELSMALYYDHVKKNTIQKYALFDKDTPLKDEVHRVIHRCRDKIGQRTQTVPQLQLKYRETEVQLILCDPFCCEDSGDSNVDDPWHPIHLSFAYHQFQRTVNTFIANPPPEKKLASWVVREKNRHIPTYKKYYIEHMNKAAASDNEFLLAIISAHGTEASRYPSSVLDFMQERQLLRSFDPNNDPAPIVLNVACKGFELPQPMTQEPEVASKTVKDNPWGFVPETTPHEDESETKSFKIELNTDKQEFLEDLSSRLVGTRFNSEVTDIAEEFNTLFETLTMTEKLYLIRNTLLDNLPQLVVTTVNVVEKFGRFLAELFDSENNFDWYIILGENLHTEYLPVWVNLLKEVSRGMKESLGRNVTQAKFEATSHKDIMLGAVKET